MTVMVTGHRKLTPMNYFGNPWPDPGNTTILNHHISLLSIIDNFCRQMATIDHMDFISGMALGADQLFAKAVLASKSAGFNVRLIAAVPFVGQEGNWPAHSRNEYHQILSRADHIEIVSPGAYSPAKMQIRNIWMVDRADTVLAVWDGAESGGTWNCISYAKSRGKIIIRLNPKTFEITGI